MELGELLKNYLAHDRPVGKTLSGMTSAKDARLNARPRRGKGPVRENTNGSEEEAREHEE